MSGSSSDTPPTTGERIYALLLMLYPRSFRVVYDHELRRLVHDRLRDDQPAGPGGVALFWVGMYADLARTAFLERWEHMVNASTVKRLGGPIATLGGLLWTVALLAVAGRVGDSSEWLTLDDVGVLLLAASVAIVVAAATLISNESVISPGWAIGGTLFAALSALCYLGGLLTGAWWLTGGANYALLIGSVLIGMGLMARRRVPCWSAMFLIVASLAMFPLNEDNWQAWLGVPFGLAWIVAGVALWTRAGDRMMPAA